MGKNRFFLGVFIVSFLGLCILFAGCGKSEFKQWKEKGLKVDTPEEKVECFTKALDCWTEKDGIPEKAKVYTKRGNAFAEKGHYDVAIGDYDRAITLDENCSEAVNGRANAATAMDRENYNRSQQ